MQKFANSYQFKYYQLTAYFTFLKLKLNAQLVIVLFLKDFFIAGNILLI